jgi:hypothetical protein
MHCTLHRVYVGLYCVIQAFNYRLSTIKIRKFIKQMLRYLNFIVTFFIFISEFVQLWVRPIKERQKPLPTRDKTTQKHKGKHPYLERDSTPRCQSPSGQNLNVRPRGHPDRHLYRRWKDKIL